MRKSLPILFAGAALLLVTPLAAFAQDDAESEPVFHYLTVTTFDSPGGEDGGLVNRYIRTVLAPIAKINPNVVELANTDIANLIDSRSLAVRCFFSSAAAAERLSASWACDSAAERHSRTSSQ